ncbi:complex I subunit 4 family protein [Janibacter sp. G56]|uniref:complex I subunit 4 family protein n=1 Tax=Janibacter sp. G56 TaxID=3418717 RepID=UPI003CFCB8B9
MALILGLLIPLAIGTWLVLAGRGLPLRAVSTVSVGAALATLIAVGSAVATHATFSRAWVPSLGLVLDVGIDGISAPLLLLTAAIGLLCVVHASRHVPAGGSPATFHGAILLVVAGALTTFAARDAVLFFLSFELVLVPMWVLITRFGDASRPDARADAGARFILYTATGSTLMLLGILFVVARAGTADLTALAAAHGAGLTHGEQVLAATLLALGLAVKVPVLPLHTWLPAAHTTAPTVGSVLLAAVLLKMGTYGLVRLPLAVVPDGFAVVAPWLAVAGAIGIVWGGLVCLVERDLKRLIAYSSVAHMGFVVLALATGSETGLQAALFGNLAHGVISALLFFLVGGLKDRWHGADLTVARPALREVAPRYGWLVVLGFAATLGLPGLVGFWGEFLALVAAMGAPDGRSAALFGACAAIAAVGAALAAAYSLRVLREIWVGDAVKADVHAPTGPAGLSGRMTPDLAGVELAVCGVLALAVVVLGVAPWLVTNPMAQTISTIVGTR